MVKNIFTKKPITLKKYGPYLLKILLCCCICFAAHRKKMVKGEKTSSPGELIIFGKNNWRQ